MKTTIKLSLLTATIITLTGCGGGASDAPANNNSNSPTGQVGDGYIQGAYVCHDSNNNMDCLDETYAITDANGAFTLSNYDASQDLLVQIPIGAVDNGPFLDGSTTPRPFTQETWYYYPAQAAPANGPIFVGPLSTLVYIQGQTVPGMSVDDATSAVASTFGISSSQVQSNYLEDNSSDGNMTHFIAELVGASLSNYSPSSVNSSNYNSYAGAVLANGNSIASTAQSNDYTTYNTVGYNVVSGGVAPTQNHAPLNFTPVADICADLENGEYFAFEEWDASLGGTPDHEHKTLYMRTDASTGEKTLEVEFQVETGGAWSIDQYHTTTETLYLQKQEGVVLDMANVNSTTVDYTAVIHDIPLPATNRSCNGSTAIFGIGTTNYKLFVSEADIAGVNGSNLPQGPSLNPILGALTFGAGDKIYKASTQLLNDAYIVEKGQNIQNGTVVPNPPSDYLVYDGSFNAMANSNDINTLVQSTSTQFIINYRDANNYERIALNTTAANNGTGVARLIKVNGGIPNAPVNKTYVVETHNGTPFFVLKNYGGIGNDLFIGQVDDVDNTNLVFGKVTRAGRLSDLTEGAGQHGDIMDDIMINASARDRVLNAQNLPIPALP